MMPYKILVIDDETSSIEVIVNILNEQNYEILVALDGLSAYDIAKKNIPDLIITDWEMENLNGIETILLLKNNELTKDIPIIMATGKRLMDKDLKTALEAGAVDYIRKPFERLELIARVRSMLLLFETMKKNRLLEKQIYSNKIISLQGEIEIQNKNLAERLIQMHSFETLFTNVKLGLEEVLEICSKNEVKLKINTLLVSCKNNNLTDVWAEFETVFEQINENFYTNLVQKFPAISPVEKRMCAFLKLNFTTKEIATISHKTIDAVKKTRHRLRKKFEMDMDEDLSIFIQRL